MNILFAGAVCVICIGLTVCILIVVIRYDLDQWDTAKRRLKKIEGKLDCMADSVEKDILKWMKFKIETELEIKSLNKKVDKIKKKLKLIQTEELEGELQKIELQVKQKELEIVNRQLSGQKDLEFQTLGLFSLLVRERFKKLKTCQEIWSEKFGSASLSVEASEWLSSTSAIPVLRIGQEEFQFFPAFILCVKDEYDIKVIDYSLLKIYVAIKKLSDLHSHNQYASYIWKRLDYESQNKHYTKKVHI